MTSPFTKAENTLKRQALEYLESAQGKLKLVAGDGLGDGERIDDAKAAIAHAMSALRLIQPAEGE